MQHLRHMLDTFRDTFTSYARRAGGEATALARRVGPKRGLIALGTIAAAVGTSYVVRYLKRRNAEPVALYEHGGSPTKKQRRKARHQAHAMQPT